MEQTENIDQILYSHGSYVWVLCVSVMSECYEWVLCVSVVCECYEWVLWVSVVCECYEWVIWMSVMCECYVLVLRVSVVCEYCVWVLFVSVMRECYVWVLYMTVTCDCYERRVWKTIRLVYSSIYPTISDKPITHWNATKGDICIVKLPNMAYMLHNITCVLACCMMMLLYLCVTWRFLHIGVLRQVTCVLMC